MVSLKSGMVFGGGLISLISPGDVHLHVAPKYRLKLRKASRRGGCSRSILDTSLACGLTVRPRANTIIDTVTYLVDETSRRWSWEVFRATVGGRDVESW